MWLGVCLEASRVIMLNCMFITIYLITVLLQKEFKKEKEEKFLERNQCKIKTSFDLPIHNL